MHTDKKILYIRLVASTFILKDEELLSNHYQVKSFAFQHRKGLQVIKELWRELMFLVRNLRSADFVYVWFADFHAVLPVLLSRVYGKKSILVIGGVDAAYDPDLKYGTKTRLLGRISVHLVTRFAHLLLPVTQHTLNQLIKNINPTLAGKSHIVPNCYDTDFEIRIASTHIRDGVVSVCLADSVKTLFVKGIDFLIQIARLLPDTQFTIIGVQAEAYDWLMERKSANTHLVGPVPQSELREYFMRSKVVCQFSRHESFGLSVLEGIAAGCFPVAHQTGGLAEILASSNGLLIKNLNVDDAVDAIQTACRKSEAEQQHIADTVLVRFSCINRINLLLEAIRSIS